MPFSGPELLDPLVTCLARCTWCKKLFRLRSDGEGGPVFEAQTCPHCGTELTFESIYRTFFENISYTSAITSANKFISFDLAIIPFLLTNLLVFFLDFPAWIRAMNFALYAGSIVIIPQWFKRYWYHFRWER